MESWLPIGFDLPGHHPVRRLLQEGDGWQIFETASHGRALVATDDLHAKWLDQRLVDAAGFDAFSFGDLALRSAAFPKGVIVSTLKDCESPRSKAGALAFAMAFRLTRALVPDENLHNAIYLQQMARLLPIYETTERTKDEVLVGAWLTGGVPLPAVPSRRLYQVLSWLEPRDTREIIKAAGLAVTDETDDAQDDASADAGEGRPRKSVADIAVKAGSFALPGRPELEGFFNEHIVDVVRNAARYAALGVPFPAATVLHGPPGCGKTFAVDQLVEFLGWPRFDIDSSTIGSPYIHETGRKIAAVFEQAIDQAPSVLVIDEMESFLADREIGSGSSHHRVEEVAEFLRRIPDAINARVLIIGMTNRIALIDPAILRRGRFDHLLEVGPATREDIRSLLKKQLEGVPQGTPIDIDHLADELSDRPLSDIAFVMREGARLSARAGLDAISEAFILDAIAQTARRGEPKPTRRIGFY